jgi:hypothetical protein
MPMPVRGDIIGTGEQAICLRIRSENKRTPPDYPLGLRPEQSEWSITRHDQCRHAAPTGHPAGLGLVAPGSSGAEPRSPDMALSDTARRILAEAAQHPLRLAASPDKLPTAAARAVLSNLLKQG